MSDSDDPPNAGPFTFEFDGGNEGGEFSLGTGDGVLRTATPLNHKIRSKYILHVRVFDNGTPPLSSDAWVTVKVKRNKNTHSYTCNYLFLVHLN